MRDDPVRLLQVLNRALRGNNTVSVAAASKDDPDMVRHAIQIGTQFGSEKRGVSLGQPENNALYSVHSLDGKDPTLIAGAIGAVRGPDP